MTVTFRAGAGSNIAGAGTLTINVPAGTANGDVMLLAVNCVSAAITDPAGWTLIQNSGGQRKLYWRLASSEPASYGVTLGARGGGIIVTYTGNDGTTPVNVSANNFSNTTTWTGASVTTTVDGCTIVQVPTSIGALTYSVATGYSDRYDQSDGNGSFSVQDTVQASQGATGTVTANQSQSLATLTFTAALAPSAASAPTNTVAPAVTGTTQVGQTLTTDNGTWTDDGSPTFTYQWQRDNSGGGTFSDIAGQTSSTHTLVTADDGCQVRCVVTDTDSGGATSANSNAVSITEPTPVNSAAPTVSGSATQGSTLSTTTGTWSSMDGVTASYAYQWTRAGVNIASATSSTYTSQAADVGHAVGCTVTATNDGGSASQASSNTVTVTAPGSTRRSTAPSISPSIAPTISGR